MGTSRSFLLCSLECVPLADIVMWIPEEARFEALQPYVTKAALHFSLKREDSLHWDPDTRQSILTDIDTWTQDLSSPPILSLTGPVGSGKTIILKEVATLTGPVGSGKTIILKEVATAVFERAHLAGEFFFWRGDPQCRVITTFATTIAHHLGFILPSASLVIRETLNNNASILQAPLEEQWESLVIQPLETLAGKTMSFRPLFIIDGIDECSSREDQLWVVQKMVELCNRFPVALLVSSLPEYHLQMEFVKYQRQFPSLFRPIIELADNDEVRQHIRLLLRPIYNAVEGEPWNNSWKPSMPLDETFETLVSDASGQMMFVTEIRQFRQHTVHDDLRDHLNRLHYDGLLQAKAFPAIDKRYDALMTSAQSYLTMEQRTLRDKIFYYLLYIQLDSIQTISIFWDTPPAQVRSVLEQYHSVLRVPRSNKRPLSFMTYTFQGFLSSEYRGGKDTKHCVSKSSLSIDAFERSIHLANHPGLHRTANAPAYLFSLWLSLEPQVNRSSIRLRWRSKRRILRLLEDFDFPAWVSLWYSNNMYEELDQKYTQFRVRTQKLSKSAVKKFDENALSRSKYNSSVPDARLGFLMKLFNKLVLR